MESPRVEEETFMDTTNGLMEMNIHGTYIYICESQIPCYTAVIDP
jgi:hypothetical protein